MMHRLTSRDMLEAPDHIEDACAAGYYYGRIPDAIRPGPNHHPAYIHGFMNARLDAGLLPPKPMHEIVSAWNLIVISESDA